MEYIDTHTYIKPGILSSSIAGIIVWGIRISACRISGLNFVILPLVSFMDYKHTFCLFLEKAIVIAS